jgi:hypothetical protein
MPLWGKADKYVVTGTVKLTNSTATATGNTASALNTELNIGDTVFISTANTAAGVNTRYRVDAIANGTSVTLGQVYNGATNNAATVWGQDTPKYILQNGQPGQRTIDVIGVDVTEAQLAANHAKSIMTPGWTSYREYTDSAGNTRRRVETLVAMRSMTASAASDANDDSTAADS